MSAVPRDEQDFVFKGIPDFGVALSAERKTEHLTCRR